MTWQDHAAGGPPVPSLLDSMEFDENPEPRCPCLVIIDTSTSMRRNRRIDQVKAGLQELTRHLEQDALAGLRAEMAVLTFSSNHELVHDFATAPHFKMPELRAGGNTNALPAIKEGLRLIQARKAQYQANGINYYRPIIIFMTDGEIISSKHFQSPEVLAVRDELRAVEQSRQAKFFAVSLGEQAGIPALELISPTTPKLLSEFKIPEFFQWLSNSMSHIGASQPEDDRIVLPSTEQWEIKQWEI